MRATIIGGEMMDKKLLAAIALLVCTFSSPAISQDIQLQNDVEVTGSVAAADPGGAVLSTVQYFIDVPGGATSLDITLIADDLFQDIDLHTRFDQRVGVDGSGILSDYFSETTGTGFESITVTDESTPPIQGGRYYIGIVNFETNPVNFTLLAGHDVSSGTGTPTETFPPLNTNTPTPSDTPGEATLTPTNTTPPPVATATPTDSPAGNPTATSTMSLLERADFDGDNTIGPGDLLILLGLWKQDVP